MSSSSSSTRSNSRTTLGIPTRCWCRSKLTTFGAQTRENLYRRFYRCQIGVKRQDEHHLFKWIGEAIIDEINMLASKQCQLLSEVQSFKDTMTQCLEENGKHIDEALVELRSFNETQTNATYVTKSHSHLVNIAAAAIAVGTMAWLYAKLSN
ncbi:uncharacterized protein At4g04775-like [Brassica napus]|nr:uncharacterized protein At4g04775-like [Brassica napus]